IGLPYAVLSRLTGLVYGAVSGFYGGTLVDIVMQRVCEIVYSMPFLPFIVMISYVLRETTGAQVGIAQIIGLLLVFGWPGVAIISRSMALSIREELYVESAIAIGATKSRIILKYIVPQLMPYFFASVMLATPGAILTEVFLSVLGLTDPNLPSWGKMISGAQLTVHAWWWIIPPGIAITLTGLAFMFLGYSIENATNPRRRRL
ncbi:MAG: ABC transporter permease, partial [Sulfolobales archaeon]